jgi:hypothetical protein
MNKTKELIRSAPGGALFGIAAIVAVVAIVLVKNKPNAEMVQLTEPSTSGIAQPLAKVGAAVTPPQVGGSTTVGTANTAVADRSSGGMAQQPGSFNQPKLYQPNNPYPDYRRTVTASDAGIGASTGTTGSPVTR